MGGGIGDIVNKVWSINDELFSARWVFDLIFFFLITVVMLNLIFGIIINTFSTIRDSKFANKEDQISKCFICNYEKGALDKIGSGFEYHIKNEHNMWSYFFYLLNIEMQEGQGLSQIESYVWKSFRRKDYSFTPYFNTLAIAVKEEKEGVDTQLSRLYEKNKILITHIQEMTKNNQNEKKLSKLTDNSKKIISKVITVNKSKLKVS